jgi:hypothetical protein
MIDPGVRKPTQVTTEETIMKLIKPIALTTMALLAGGNAWADARVAVAHFAPFADTLEGTSVSVALNGTVALEGVRFKDFTGYIDLPAGTYTVDIIPTGTTDPAITATYTLQDGQDYTVFASGNGTLQPLGLFALADDNSAPAAGNVKVRIVHAAPFADTLEGTEVSIRTGGGDLVAGLQGVPFGVDSGYLELPAATYDLKVASNDGLVNLIDPLPAALPAGAVLTVFAVGDVANQPLGIIAMPVGELPVGAPLDESANGIFKLEGFDGEGFYFVPIPKTNRVVGSWYTYNARQFGAPIWYTFESEPGDFDGVTATTTLYLSSGANALGDPQSTNPIGQIMFEVIDCSTIMATVSIDGGSSTDYTGVRLNPTAACAQ